MNNTATLTVMDLRIGNYLHNAAIGISTCYKVKYLEESFTTFGDPIPLTPELLERAGFKVEREQAGISAYKGGFSLWKGSNWDGFTYSVVGRNGDGMNEPDINVPYLHTLQNLFYYLEGQELIINL